MTDKKHLFAAGYIDHQETYDSPYFTPSDFEESKNKYILCGLCKKPIKALELGAIEKGENDNSLFYHKMCWENKAENVDL